jgi:hypothetical protein
MGTGIFVTIRLMEEKRPSGMIITDDMKRKMSEERKGKKKPKHSGKRKGEKSPHVWGTKSTRG